jgi:hypothetical protein
MRGVGEGEKLINFYETTLYYDLSLFMVTIVFVARRFYLLQEDCQYHTTGVRNCNRFDLSDLRNESGCRWS